jgi:hypothetical protein
MEHLPPEALSHVIREQRESLSEMYERGDFGAHTLAVYRLLNVQKINAKEMFAHGEEYLPKTDDLPNNGIASYFKMMSMLTRLSTPQKELAINAEEYSASEPHSLTHNPHDIRQRFVWERSDELSDPFVD